MPVTLHQLALQSADLLGTMLCPRPQWASASLVASALLRSMPSSFTGLSGWVAHIFTLPGDREATSLESIAHMPCSDAVLFGLDVVTRGVVLLAILYGKPLQRMGLCCIGSPLVQRVRTAVLRR